MLRPRHTLFALLTLCHPACHQDSPEGQVRAAFNRCVDAVEAADAGAATEALAPDFQGPDGLDKGSARLYLMGIFRQERVGITVVSQTVRVQGKRADQQVELLLTGRKGSGLLPQEATRRTYALRWEGQGNAWRLKSLTEVAAP